MTRALVTGVAGQDGVYLARSLARDGVRVLGTVSPGSTSRRQRGTYLHGIEVVEQDLRDADGMRRLIDDWAPDEVYNLAALSSVARSWNDPERAAAVNAGAVRTLLEGLLDLQVRTGQQARFFQASSAEVLGDAAASPYARSKARAEELVVDCRATHGLHASFATLHNHESPLRGLEFVTRKITRAAAEIAAGKRESLELGNLEVSRDWGFAGEYVEAMRRMLQLDEPVDVVIGTGSAHSLEELLVTAFAAAGITDPWPWIERDPGLLRPVDATFSVADPEPAASLLGWRATVSFEDLVAGMVRIDVARVRSGVEEDPRYLSAGPGTRLDQ